MFHENPNLVTKKCDGESRRKIERKLSNIQNVIDLDDIDCTFSDMEMTPDQYLMTEIEEQMKMWRYLSRLAIYLHNDYDFFTQMIVKISFPSPVFTNAMKDLGYKRKGNAWFQEERPEQSVIINTIFNYCFYCSLFNLMEKENTEKFQDKAFCSLCESEMPSSSEVCAICYTVNKHNKIGIMKQNKIESMQKDYSKNVDRPFEYREEKLDLSDKEDEIDTKSSVYSYKDTWICEECTFKNEERNNNCVLCFTQRKFPINEAEMSDGQTLDIKNNITTGSTVESAEKPVLRKVEENYWNCPKCTYKNRNDYAKCFVCNFYHKNYLMIQLNKVTNFFKNPMHQTNSESNHVTLDDSVVNKRSEEDIEIEPGKNGLARANSVDDSATISWQETIKSIFDRNTLTSKLFK